MENEIWKNIPRTNGSYSASNLGNVKSNDRQITNSLGVTKKYKGILLKFSRSGWGGYYFVQLSDINNKKFRECVHRIVARTFIPNPNNKPQVNHIDGDKLNNRLENLEWVTQSENMQHAYDIGLTNIKKGVLSPNYGKRGQGVQSKKVINLETGEIFLSCGQASEKTGIPRTTLVRWLTGISPNKSNLIYV